MQGLKSAQGVRCTRHVAPIASRSLLRSVVPRFVVAREQSSVQQLVVEEVESVESAAVEQQQEHGQMQVVKPVEKQAEKQAVSSSNGNGKAKKEKEDSSDTTAQGSLAKVIPQAKTVRNLVFVTSEVAPWSKTGGLGDVLGSLPIALAARGHRVMVVTPRYSDYAEPTYSGTTININGNEVGMYHYAHKGVDWVFVDHPCYPRPGGIYADEHGVYGDNQFRYQLLCLAAMEAPLQLPLGEKGLYGQDCVFIANDWHAALVPVYLAAKYRPYGVYTNARSVMAIHNLRHQGVFPPGTFPSLGLPDGWYQAMEYQYPPHLRQGAYEEEGRSVNTLKAGITVADRLVTVSPGYAEEIRTWLGGWGMEGMIDARGPVLNGIVNGIDDEDWNPAVDKHLPVKYDISSFKAGKAACKKALQEELGLPVNADIPLIAFIGRLDYQKGADIVLQAAPWMMSQGVQLVCLGTGTTDLENGLRWLEAAYRDQARGWVGFNVAMSHKITAAADILLMPSRFEPCGLNQLYAMAYGAVPVAHATGGLRDTVLDFNPESQTGTGWTFSSCDASGLMHATGLALATLRDYPNDFEGIQRRGMQRDSSWNGAAEQYEQIFEWAIMDQPYA
uniref:starch synthase n=2 Tax=Tetradesmus obliquus TaxID=3088 RepID=A0A383VM81_TETOB|eukprot:jgi/Sobl393_1/17543/SZX65794.1